MDRQAAHQLLERRLSNRNLLKHCLAVEAAMQALARSLGRPAEEIPEWGLAGLLHDLDYQETLGRPERHGIMAAGELAEQGVSAEIRDAICAHCGNGPRRRPMDQALYGVDPLTGLIVSAALMHPARRLAGLDPGFVLRRYRERRFAAGASREQIEAGCAGLGLELEEFIGVVLEAMKGIHKELGL